MASHLPKSPGNVECIGERLKAVSQQRLQKYRNDFFSIYLSQGPYTRNQNPWIPPGRYTAYSSASTPLPGSRSPTRSRLSPRRRPMSAMEGERDLDVQRIGEEYIKDLQQQIYVLELENECLYYSRGHTQRAEEAARHLTERVDEHASDARTSSALSEDLQQQVTQLNVELRRKGSSMQAADTECSKLRKQIENLKSAKETQRQYLLAEIETAREETRQVMKDADKQKQRELSTQTKLSTTKRLLGEANKRCQELQHQLDKATTQLEDVQARESRHRAATLDLKYQLESAHQKAVEHEDCIARSHYKIVKDDGITSRAELKKARLDLENLTVSKKKAEDACELLVHENSELRSKKVTLEKKLEKARTVLEHRDQQKQTMIKELVTLRESNEDSRNAAARMAEIELSQEEELERVKQKLKEKEDLVHIVNVDVSDMTQRLSQVEAAYRACQEEAVALQSEKAILLDKATEKDFQISTQEKDLERLKLTNSKLRTSLAELSTRRQALP